MKNFVTKESDRKEEEFLYYLSSLKSNEHGHYSKDSRALAESMNHDGTIIEDHAKNVDINGSQMMDGIETLKRELELEKIELEKEREEDRRREDERTRREDERMAELMRELKESRSEDIMRELKESRSNDMKSMFMLQLGMVTLGCVASGLAIYIHFTRARKASNSTNSLV